ncbi:MAG: hypothetical protein ACHREM_11450 [Polyangiales bacterium]
MRSHISACTTGSRWTIAIAMACAGTFAPSTASATGQFVNLNVAVPTTTLVGTTLSAGTHTVSTSSAAGVDPVLYVLTWSSGSEWPDGQVAYNDDCPPGGTRDSCVTFNVPIAGPYFFFIHAYRMASSGNTTIKIDGAAWRTNQYVGGNSIEMPVLSSQLTSKFEASEIFGSPYVAFTALRRGPGGAADGGGFFAMADVGGVSYMPLIQANTPIGRIVVWNDVSSAVLSTHLYANDAYEDVDGDGLGSQLELALGTCDSTTTSSSCSAVVDPRDSDHDGLRDDLEVFGFDDATFPQTLPMWGANPRHKDMFMEFDYDNAGSFTTVPNPFTSSDATQFSAYFAAGTASDLVQFDGNPGITVHVDMATATTYAGGAPGSPPYQYLKGSSQVTGTTDYHTAYSSSANFSNVRRGIFRYSMLNVDPVNPGGNTANVPGDHSGWSTPDWSSSRGMGTIGHEVGHQCGLQHSGADKDGAFNCKPIYHSMMNYAYGGQDNTVGFSQGTYSSLALQASSADEISAFGGLTPPAYLAAAGPFFFRVASGASIDWNFDGTLDGTTTTSVRGPINWAPWAACSLLSAAIGNNLVESLASTGYVTAAPDITMVGSRLFAFSITSATSGVGQKIGYFSQGTTTDPTKSSCTSSGGPTGTCGTWTLRKTLSTAATPVAQSVVPWGTGVLVVYRDSSNLLHEVVATVDGSGTVLTPTSENAIGISAQQDPELVLVPAGATTVPWLFYVSTGGVHSYATRGTTGTWTSLGGVNPGGSNIAASFGPGIATVPWGVCGAFPTATDHPLFTGKTLSIACYSTATSSWTSYDSTIWNSDGFSGTAGSGEAGFFQQNVVGKPTLAYRTVRGADGSPLNGDASVGQLYVLSPAAYGDSSTNGMLEISSVLSASSPISSATRFTSGVGFGFWDALVSGTGAAFYDSPSLTAMKGVAYWMAGSSTNLNLMSVADGTFNTVQRDTPDFQVMERGLCAGLPSSGSSVTCGTSNKWGY